MIEENDKTGSPPSNRDIEEAISVMRKVLVKWIANVPPELAVNSANILRCLQYLKEIKP